VLAVVYEFWERDYFVEAFGYFCVDNDWTDGILGKRPERWFLVTIGRDNVWPIRERGAAYVRTTTMRSGLAGAFYVYLATIHAVLRLKERESKAAAVQQA